MEQRNLLSSNIHTHNGTHALKVNLPPLCPNKGKLSGMFSSATMLHKIVSTDPVPIPVALGYQPP